MMKQNGNNFLISPPAPSSPNCRFVRSPTSHRNFPLFSCHWKLPAVSFKISSNCFCGDINHNRRRALKEQSINTPLCYITPTNCQPGLVWFPARVLIRKAKQIFNKHSSKGLVSKHRLAEFLADKTRLWHLPRAFLNFQAWLVLTSSKPINRNKSSSSSWMHLNRSGRISRYPYSVRPRLRGRL